MFGRKEYFEPPVHREPNVPNGWMHDWNRHDFTDHILPYPSWGVYNNGEYEKALESHETSIDCFCNPAKIGGYGGDYKNVYYHNNITKEEGLNTAIWNIAYKELQEDLLNLNLTRDEDTAVTLLLTLAKPIKLPLGEERRFAIILKEDREALNYNDIRLLIEKEFIQLVDFQIDMGLILEVIDYKVMNFIEDFN